MPTVDPSGTESSTGPEPRLVSAPDRASGLLRDRLTSRLTDPGTFQVGWLVAPAGSGKSRLLLHVSQGYEGPVAWCSTPDPPPRSEPALVGWIWPAIAAAAGADRGRPPASVSELVGTAIDGDLPLLVCLDDVHLLEGSEAEAALGDLVARLPERWRLVMASRVSLGFDLSRMRVAGDVVDIGPDDLRFRTWEVEELFRDVYGEPLVPEDVAVLARRTSGWAAYLQLFFLATARKPHAERRLVLGSLQNRTRLVSEYLGRHVLAGLDPELQDFLVRTSVLRRPSAALCDEFLGRSGSAELLAALERRQLFTERIDDHTYRYHTVMVSYLDAQLVETMGLEAAKGEHHRAAGLLEREGRSEEALVAYARAEDWAGVAKVVGGTVPGTDIIDDAWIDAIPPAVLESDPLLLLVRAHQAVARGSIQEAVQVLRQAESVSVSTVVAERCRREREQIQMWSDPSRPQRSDWVGMIRAATQRQPAQVQRQAAALPGVAGRFAEGCAAFLAGDHPECVRLMRGVSQHPDAPRPMAAGAAILGAVAGEAAGHRPSREETDRIFEEVDASGVRWLNRVARAALVVEPGSDETTSDLIDACDREGDQWGAALIGALSGIAKAAHRTTGAEAALEAAARMFGQLGAGVLQAMCLGYEAVALGQAGRTQATREVAGRARSLAATHEAPGAAGLSELALALVSGGLDQQDEVNKAYPSKPAELRCLGGYSLRVEGEVVDDSAAKPMERALLHLLSARAGEIVHREDLIAALWPDAAGDAGLHRLQTGVSALRRLLSGNGGLVVRSGEGYGLVLPPGSDSDVASFEQAVQRGAAAKVRGDGPEEERYLADALDIYSGPLLPGDGPAEWVVEPRRRFEVIAAESAARLATLRLDRDDPVGAVQAARAGITIDRYRDDLWKSLITGCERAGHHADAERARKSYEAILAELGV